MNALAARLKSGPSQSLSESQFLRSLFRRGLRSFDALRLLVGVE